MPRFTFVRSLSVLPLLLTLSKALPTTPGRIPNGQNPDLPCMELGHIDCVAGGPRNQFGMDFGEAHMWTTELCMMDSDGDGLTNGEELGDPCCTWQEGDSDEGLRMNNLSNPGDPMSTEAMGLPGCPDGGAMAASPLAATPDAVDAAVQPTDNAPMMGGKLAGASPVPTGIVDQVQKGDYTPYPMMGNADPTMETPYPSMDPGFIPQEAPAASGAPVASGSYTPYPSDDMAVADMTPYPSGMEIVYPSGMPYPSGTNAPYPSGDMMTPYPSGDMMTPYPSGDKAPYPSGAMMTPYPSGDMSAAIMTPYPSGMEAAYPSGMPYPSGNEEPLPMTMETPYVSSAPSGDDIGSALTLGDDDETLLETPDAAVTIGASGPGGAAVEATPEGSEEPNALAECFPADATVTLKDGSHKPMSQLNVGDEVLAALPDTYSPVYMFSHKESHSTNSFVRIVASNGLAITATPGHYIIVDGSLKAASAVTVGDKLMTKDGEAAVASTEVVRMSGLYNPHTLAGSVVVDGVLASDVTTAVKPSVARTLLAPFKFMYGVLKRDVSGGLLNNGWASLAKLGPVGAKEL